MKREGFSLLELMTVVILVGILAAFGVPQFRKSMEQSRLDMAAANLESVWTAQRLYKAKEGQFAASLGALGDFLDESFLAKISDSENPFAYSTGSENPSSDFWAQAVRQNSGSWSGTLSISATGILTGQIDYRSGGTWRFALYPPKF